MRESEQIFGTDRQQQISTPAWIWQMAWLVFVVYFKERNELQTLVSSIFLVVFGVGFRIYSRNTIQKSVTVSWETIVIVSK